MLVIPSLMTLLYTLMGHHFLKLIFLICKKDINKNLIMKNILVILNLKFFFKLLNK